jgi:Ca2+-binding EF-hand superfamily protein
VKTLPLSRDHTASYESERAQVQADHPKDPTAVVKMSEDDDDWRVKAIAAFTRSIGDTQLKDKAAATLYNSYTAGMKVMPRPGVKAKGEPNKTKPYISADAEIQADSVTDGFLIVACDGVWDEMSSEQAVKIVAGLFEKHKGTDANIADLFIEETLKCAVDRIKSTIEEEEDITLEELKARPVGKKDLSWRSCLHDDITAVILHFVTDPDMETIVTQKLTSTDPVAMALELFAKIDTDHSGRLDKGEIAALATGLGKSLSLKELEAAMGQMDADGDGEVDADEFSAWWLKFGLPLLQRSKTTRIRSVEGSMAAVLEEVTGAKGDATRSKTDTQIMKVMKTMEGIKPEHLHILFTALDTDENGDLDRSEITKLLAQVLGEAATEGVLTTAFAEMDADNSGSIDFGEFAAFFGIDTVSSI